MLIDEFLTPCVMMDKTRTTDGEGGYTTTWVESVEFEAAITAEGTALSNAVSRIAQREGVANTYTITTKKGIKLDFHDVIKRRKDGKYFRVTSLAGDKETPASSTLNIAQVTAEPWELTTV